LPDVSVPEAAPLPRGTELVLVADDEPQIRELCARLLGNLGYRVLAARDGATALATLDEHPDVDLVLTDMVMPGMGGSELVTALLARAKRPRLVVMSGYSEELVVSGWEEMPFLAKPFTVTELAGIVRKVLDG
jgi:CheY-like chemotaxis protein